MSDDGKKLNPRFIMGAKKKSDTEKALDEIAKPVKKVVRRNWAGGATLAKGGEVVDNSLSPALDSGEVAVDFETVEVVDNLVDSVDAMVDETVERDVSLLLEKPAVVGKKNVKSSLLNPVGKKGEVVDNVVDEDDVFDDLEVVDDVGGVVDNVVDEDVRGDAFNEDSEERLVEVTPPVVKSTGRVVNSRFDLGRSKPVSKPVKSVVDLEPLVDEDESSGVPFRGAKGVRPRKKDGEHKDKRPSVLIAKSAVEAGDWDDVGKDTVKGLNAEGDTNTPEPELGSGFHLTERDILIIRFLARYRYAYNFQIARLCDTSPKAINIRLRKLAERGFIKKKTVTGAQHIWLSTKAGNLVADVDLPAIKDGQLSWVTVAHTLGLVNIGVELEIGGDNLLKEVEWPLYNKRDRKGNPVIGERVLTEKEIRQGQQKWRMNRTTAEMRDMVEAAVVDTGNAYVNEATGEISYPDAPELLEGNEGLYVVYGTLEHIPDMVIQRGRDADGKPVNIAIELELNQKTTEDWKRILRTYRDYGSMYDKVIYFTHKRSIYNLLNKINQEDIGLPPEKFMIRQYVPKNDREPFWG